MKRVPKSPVGFSRIVGMGRSWCAVECDADGHYSVLDARMIVRQAPSYWDAQLRARAKGYPTYTEARFERLTTAPTS